MDFNGNQTVQGPKDSFSANCSKGFKRFQTMNKGKNLHFFSTEERKTWRSWMTWGRVNYQHKFF